MKLAVSPTLQEVVAHDGPERHAILRAFVSADMLTPISTFARLVGDDGDAFMLESAESGRSFGRWSFIGIDVAERLVMRDGVATRHVGDEVHSERFEDPLHPIRARLARWTAWSPDKLPPFVGGAVGYLGFDCVRYFEPVGLPAGEGLGLPEAVMLFCDAVCAFDHLHHRVELLVHIPLDGDREAAYRRGQARIHAAIERLDAPSDIRLRLGAGEHDEPDARSNRSADDMRAAVRTAREAIGDGEVFQVVVSQRLSMNAAVDPLTAYRVLRTINPSPYMFLLRLPEFALVGASPEVLVHVLDRELLLRPIAGTRRRGRNEAEDLALEADLLSDEKELAEHRMLVDLGRNDAGRVGDVGSVRVERPLRIERYSHVMHIVSDVRARLRTDLDVFDALRAGFPAGTVSGAPKVRACELLAKLEPDRRGPYAGAIGWFGVDGNMDTAIAIRTLVIEPDAVHVQAGAGVVWDSSPQAEHQECLHKARGPLSAVAAAAGGRR